MTDTEEILDTARYLRNVRPVDPDEIYEYVESKPHPAVVRRTLREHAFELEIREREDGRFVPIEAGPIAPTFNGVERFPEPYARRFEELLVERFGVGWPDGEAGDRLRTRIDELKVSYFADESVTYDEDTAFAYALYHLPDYYAAIQYALDEIGRAGLLSRKIRILDVGGRNGRPGARNSRLSPRGHARRLRRRRTGGRNRYSGTDARRDAPRVLDDDFSRDRRGVRTGGRVRSHRVRERAFGTRNHLSIVAERYLDALAPTERFS